MKNVTIKKQKRNNSATESENADFTDKILTCLREKPKKRK